MGSCPRLRETPPGPSRSPGTQEAGLSLGGLAVPGPHSLLHRRCRLGGGLAVTAWCVALCSTAPSRPPEHGLCPEAPLCPRPGDALVAPHAGLSPRGRVAGRWKQGCPHTWPHSPLCGLRTGLGQAQRRPLPPAASACWCPSRPAARRWPALRDLARTGGTLASRRRRGHFQSAGLCWTHGGWRGLWPPGLASAASCTCAAPARGLPESESRTQRLPSHPSAQTPCPLLQGGRGTKGRGRTLQAREAEAEGVPAPGLQPLLMSLERQRLHPGPGTRPRLGLGMRQPGVGATVRSSFQVPSAQLGRHRPLK